MLSGARASAEGLRGAVRASRLQLAPGRTLGTGVLRPFHPLPSWPASLCPTHGRTNITNVAAPPPPPLCCSSGHEAHCAFTSQTRCHLPAVLGTPQSPRMCLFQSPHVTQSVQAVGSFWMSWDGVVGGHPL